MRAAQAAEERRQAAEERQQAAAERQALATAVRAWGDGEIGDWAPAEPGGEPVPWMPTSIPEERKAELMRLMAPALEACGALVRRLVAALEAIPEAARGAVRAALAGETATALAEDDDGPAPVWSVPQK